jgi:hypothetical protein
MIYFNLKQLYSKIYLNMIEQNIPTIVNTT